MMDGMVKIWGMHMIFKNLLDMFFSKDDMLRFTLLYIFKMEIEIVLFHFELAKFL